MYSSYMAYDIQAKSSRQLWTAAFPPLSTSAQRLCDRPSAGSKAAKTVSVQSSAWCECPFSRSSCQEHAECQSCPGGRDEPDARGIVADPLVNERNRERRERGRGALHGSDEACDGAKVCSTEVRRPDQGIGGREPADADGDDRRVED